MDRVNRPTAIKEIESIINNFLKQESTQAQMGNFIQHLKKKLYQFFVIYSNR